MRLRTRLLDRGSRRSDDAQLLGLVRELPRTSATCNPTRAGLLNEAGQVYREVHLYGEYESLLFAARMNACGFTQLDAPPPAVDAGYEYVFGKR